MLSGPNSTATCLVTPREANLFPTYATLGAPTTATMPAVELMLTIAPPPASFMNGTTVFIPPDLGVLVDGDDLEVGLGVEVDHLGDRAEDAGVVDQDVDGAEGLDRLRRDRLPLLERRHVVLEEQGVVAQLGGEEVRLEGSTISRAPIPGASPRLARMLAITWSGHPMPIGALRTLSVPACGLLAAERFRAGPRHEP